MSLASQVTALAQAIGADIKALLLRSLPTGGSTGQVLAKKSATNYDVEWANPGSVTAPLELSANSASPTLKLVQTGFGNVLEVHDEASDTSVFHIDAAGGVYTGGNIIVRPPATGGEGGQIELTGADRVTVAGILDSLNSTVVRLFSVTPNAEFKIGQLGSTGGSVSLFTDSVETLRASGGNVGIGMTASYKLDVYGAGRFGTTGKMLVNNDGVNGSFNNSVGHTLFYTPADKAFIWHIDGAQKMQLSSLGYLGIGGSPSTKVDAVNDTAADTYFRSRNSVAASGYDFGVSAGGTAYLFNRNNTELVIGTNNLSVIRVGTDRNTGFGMSASYKLDVYGTGRFGTTGKTRISNDGNCSFANDNGSVNFSTPLDTGYTWSINGVQHMRLTSSGAFNINTRLDIDEDAQLVLGVGYIRNGHAYTAGGIADVNTYEHAISNGYCRRESIEALGASTTLASTGTAAPTVVGTATSRSVATTNRLTKLRRIGYVSAATAGSLSGHYKGQAQHTLYGGTTPNRNGGFSYVCVFAASDAAAVSGAMMFVGMTSSTGAPTNVEPNTLTNAIGVGQLSTDSTQLYWIVAGSAAQTAVALGTSFPIFNGSVSANNGVPYLLEMFQRHQSTTLIMQLTNLLTGAVARKEVDTTVAATCPTYNTLLAHRVWRSNNATSMAVGVDFAHYVCDDEILTAA